MSQTKAQLISDLVQALNFTGTASAPANGLFLSAANTLQLSTASTPRLTINSDGHVDVVGNLDVGAGIDVTGNITATGTITSNDITIQDQQPRLNFVDNAGSPNDPDYLFQVDGGQFVLHDNTNGVNKLVVNSDGHIDFIPNVDFSAGIDVTGNITTTGSITATAGTITSQDITIQDQQPRLNFVDNAGSPNDPDYLFQVDGGQFVLHDNTNGANKLTVESNGTVTIPPNCDFGAGIDVTGNITTTGNITASGGQLTLEDTNEQQIHRFWSNISDSDIYALLSGSTFGTIVEGANNGHHVIALRDNDANDSVAIISGGGDFKTGSPADTYDKLVARFRANGNTVLGGDLQLSGNITIENTLPEVFLKDSDNNDDFAIKNAHGVFTVRDATNGVDRLTIASDGKGTFTTALDVTGDLTVESTLPQISLKDTNNDDDFTIKNNNGVFTVRDATNGVDRLTIDSNGATVFNDSGANADFRIEGDSDANLFVVDASADAIGIGAAPATTGMKMEISRSTADAFVNASDCVLRLLNTNTSADTNQTSLEFTTFTTGVGADSAIVSQAEDASGNSRLEFWTDTANGMTEKMVITSAGKIGVGVDPAQKVHIAAGSGQDSYFRTDTVVNGGLLLRVDDVQRGVFANDSAFNGTKTDIGIGAKGSLVFRTGTSTYEERMRINSGGTVNIGDSSSQSTHLLYLQSTGDAGIHIRADRDNSGENDNPYVSMSQDGSTAQLLKLGLVGEAGQEFAQSIANASFLHANAANAQPLQLAHMDNLAVTFSNTEQSHFHSFSGVATGGVKIANRGNDTGAALLLQGHNNTGTPGQPTNTQLTHLGSNLTFEITHNGSRAIHVGSTRRIRLPGVPGVSGSGLVNVSIESDGNLCTQSSLRAHKINITSISDTSWLYNLNPVTFNWRTKTEVDGENVWGDTADNNGTQYGLIAEEVETVKKDFCYYNNNDELSGVHYDRMIAPLIKALQEQKAEIDTLKTRVAALEAA